jgi:asparagine synthase (glutamine-hydrolysing)
MCGITAVFSRRSDVASDTMSAGTAALDHRGPDGRQHWISPDGRVGLGHARLSIIDLSTGDQPIANEDGSLVIVHNGEFYDFERIRAGLEARGHRFRTKSDSEVALHLYEELGPECVHQLRGEFAFIIWDSRNQRLFAARDRFGVKPLFYAEQDGALYFASEAKALFAMGVEAAWSYESVFAGAFLIPAERTLFKGVYNVPPGHFMRATPEGFRLQQYWDVNYPRDDAAPAPRTDREYIEGFRAVLEESVKTRLRADVPVGCYLSGGIDSCAILGLASLHHVGPVRAYTLTFEAGAYDESVTAEEMAKRAGAEYRPVTAHQHDLADNFRAAVIQAELPCKNAHTVAKYMLSRAVRADGRKVVLTGEGSDELLAGYPHFRRDMLLHHTQGQSPEDVQRLMNDLVANNQVSRGMLMPEGDSAVRDSAVRDSAVRDSARAVLEFVPSWLETQAIDSKSTKSIMSDEFVAAQGDTDTVGTFLASIDVKRCLEGRNAVHSALYLWAKSALPHYVLSNLGDRMEMGHSVEGRVPFMDHHVAEYLQNVPVNLKIRSMTEKYILREAVKDVITDTVYKRQKHPFLSPPSTHHRDAPLHQLMQDTLRSSAARDVPFLDQGKLIAMLDGIDHTNPGLAAVTDINLTVAMSYVFMHEGLRLGS